MDDYSALKSNTLLAGGRYRIKRVLGKGGFGITYLAFDLLNNKEVAIKELFPSLFCHRDANTSNLIVGGSGNEEQMEKLKKQFLNEAHHLAALKNNGIVRVYGSFQQFNTVYYVMDYINGHTLSEIVEVHGPFVAKKAIQLISKVCDSLIYLHSVKMNHLDIKPSNIMIRLSDKMPVLIDFGLSLHFDNDNDLTFTMPYGVSDGFAAKEQYIPNSLKSFSPQTDIYSLGATLYFMITGKKPKPSIQRESDHDLYFPENFPPKLKYPIVKAMALTKTHRFQTVSDFKRAMISSLSSNSEVTSEKTQHIHQVHHSAVSNKVRDNNSNNKVKHKGESSSNQWFWIAAIALLAGLGVYFSINNPSGSSTSYDPVPVDTFEEVIEEEVNPSKFYALPYDTVTHSKYANYDDRNSQNTASKPDFNYYDEGYSKFRLPSSFKYRGKSEEDMEESIFSDGTAQFFTTSTPEEYVNFEDPFQSVISDTMDDYSPTILADTPGKKIAKGYNSEGDKYYTKWVIRNGTVYMGTLIYPQKYSSRYDKLIPDIFDHYATSN